jgi:hypothetical protein
MIQRFTAHFSGFDHDEQLLLHFRLTMKVIEVRRAHGEIKRGVGFGQNGIHKTAFLAWES